MRRNPVVVFAATLGLALALGVLAPPTPPVAAQSTSTPDLFSLVRLVNGVVGAILQEGPWTLTVPPGALRGTTQVTMVRLPGRAPLVSLELADPSLNDFTRPVTLTWHAAVAADATDKTIYWWNPQTFRWEEVPGVTVNLQTGDVSAPLSHFSVYSVGGKAGW